MLEAGDLTERERELVAATEQGEILTCSDLPPEELANSEDPQHVIRAEVIREILRGRLAGEADPHGVRLNGARITGQLDLENLHTKLSLVLKGCVLDNRLVARDARLSTVRLERTQLPAFAAPRLRTEGLLRLRGCVVTSDQDAVNLLGAHIQGNLDFRAAKLTGRAGIALRANGIRVDGNVFLRDGFTATSHETAVYLRGSDIRGSLECSTAHLKSDIESAIDLRASDVGGSVFLRREFTAETSSDEPVIFMSTINIGRELDCTGATLKNSAGPVLTLARGQVRGVVWMRTGFVASGHGTKPAMTLSSATIGGLSCLDAALSNPDGPVLNLVHTTTPWVELPPDFLCSTTTACHRSVITIEGLTYSNLGQSKAADWHQWLHWLRDHTTEYTAQPYQQLATVQRAAGHDAAAREILVAQQRDRRRRGEIGSWWRKAWHAAWGGLAGYGYRPGRIAVALFFMLFVAGGLGVAAGNTSTDDGRRAAIHTPRADQPGSPCSLVEQIGLGIDRGLPLGVTGVRDRCDLNTTSAAGQWYTATIWLLQALVWALATLTITGYTALIRKIT